MLLLVLPNVLLALSASVGAATTPSSSAASSASPSGTGTVSGSGSGSVSVSGSTTVASPLSLTTVPVSLLSTNPTAVPIASLTSGMPSQATSALDTTYAAGATPSAIPNAPPLPDISAINPANYPPLDKPPPINTTEVQQWISEVASSGIEIPGIAPTLPGGCATNPAAVTNASSSGTCWWTCGHCTRITDISTCADKLTWGSSFDDGPSPDTPSLLTYLDANDIKTTFFVVGSRVISRPQFLQTEYMDGHQICVHTWSHPSLTTQSTEQVIAEFGWSKKVIKDVLGVTPNCFRPPFGDIDDRIRAIARAMGLTPIIWTSAQNFTFDTNDFNIPGGLVSSSQVLENFETILNTAPTLDTGFIVLEHDLFPQTVDLAIGYVLPDALAFQPKLTLKPIIECINLPMSDAYIETNNNSTNPPPDSSAGSTGVVTASTGAPGSLQSPSASPSPSAGSKGSSAAVMQNPSVAVMLIGLGLALLASQ